MADPKLTVILPVFNAEQYLCSAIDSLLVQSFRDFELIAVNDGSTDGSAGLLDKYAAADPRVRVMHQENQGVSVSCNAAIDAGRGIYVARMDADDLAHPQRFEKQIAHMDGAPDLVALGTWARLIDPDGRPLKTLELPLEHTVIDQRHASGKGLLSICNPSVMMRMAAVRQVGRYDEDFRSAHDIEIFLRLAEIGRLSNLPEVLLDYRMHQNSIGHSGRTKQLHRAWLAAKMAAERRGMAFEAPEPSPTAKAASKDALFRKWGWWAMAGKNVPSARYYARKAVIANPLALENWRLAGSALRGH